MRSESSPGGGEPLSPLRRARADTTLNYIAAVDDGRPYSGLRWEFVYRQNWASRALDQALEDLAAEERITFCMRGMYGELVVEERTA